MDLAKLLRRVDELDSQVNKLTWIIDQLQLRLIAIEDDLATMPRYREELKP